MPEFSYPAYRTFQVEEGKALVMFSAPAAEIETWAGVPQRLRLDDRETIGFQREKKDERVREIAAFFADRRNVVQNPLLAAQQNPVQVRFDPFDDENLASPFGTIRIDTGDLPSLGMLELLQLLAAHIRARVESDDALEPDEDRIAALMLQAQERYSHRLADDRMEPVDSDDTDDSQGSETQTDAEPEADLGAAALLSEYTNITDFYKEVLARIEVIKRTGMSWRSDEFLDFDRDAILAYLLPVVLVDGQHRLRGAVLAAKNLADDAASLEYTFQRIADGATAPDVNADLLAQNSRKLPISLLMDPSPSEHVFQFVVVNQKATPLSAALLGTIVATSLVEQEVEEIGERLRDAKIKFDDSRAIAWLTRNPNSPFFNCVQTGVNGDGSNLLQWTVLQGLVKIFRDLTGGRIYGLTNDHAAIWGKWCLPESGYVAEAATVLEKKRAWKAQDGPWREVFVRFYTRVRDDFADPDPLASNGWGDTKESNLFNKPSLTILAADFFKSMHTKNRTLGSVADVDAAFDEWVGRADGRRYFARAWDFGGKKKDSDPVKKALAQLWSEYRENPERVPPISKFQF